MDPLIILLLHIVFRSEARFHESQHGPGFLKIILITLT